MDGEGLVKRSRERMILEIDKARLTAEGHLETHSRGEQQRQ